MPSRTTGVLSILLVFAALILAVYQLTTLSVLLGLIYLLYIPLAFYIVLYNYCRKCPHVTAGTCRHIIFGKIVLKYMNPKDPAKYNSKELLLTLSALMVLMLFPQYWLFQTMWLFITFWVLMLIAVVMVVTSVCKGCHNTHCAFCPNKNKCQA